MTSLNELTELLEAFELHLGDPSDTRNLVNTCQILSCDEEEKLPWSQIHYIQQWGYMDYLIPQYAGGKMSSLFESYCLTKSIARRDITTAIALGLSFFAALPTWISGTSSQQKLLGERISKGDIGAYALTEEDHGSDLTANEVRAIPHEGGWLLSGSKWCINFATFGQMTTVLCRTNEKGGVLGFSLFFIDKSILKSGYNPTPKLPTHGVRGLDISGFSLDKLWVPKEAIIGTVHRGLEITYKALQVSRTLCACMSVGGADTALRLAVSFSVQRALYGKTAFDIPVVKQRLGEQLAQLLIADCTTLVIVRACTSLPEKMSLWSAVIKYLIPQIAEDIVEQCGIVIGARAYLRTTEWALFQKIRRDIEVIGLFDGSSQVNLSLIAGNLLPQAGMRGSNQLNGVEKIEQIFKLNAPCPQFDGNTLGLFAHEEDDIMAGLAHIHSESIDSLISLVREQLIKLDQEVLTLKDQKLFDPRGLAAFRLAERYCWIFAASCCLQFWHYNQELLPKELRGPEWITLAIQLILKKLHANPSIDIKLQEIMAGYLCSYFEENRMFSVMPTKIAG